MYTAHPQRYNRLPYRTVGKSGLKLPSITLGLWHNFGDATPMETQRSLLRTAFDLGITHFDLANNYGPPAGSAETNFGEHLLRRVIDELYYDLLVRPRVLLGMHIPGIGLNQVYEWNEVPQLPNVRLAMRELATEPA